MGVVYYANVPNKQRPLDKSPPIRMKESHAQCAVARTIGEIREKAKLEKSTMEERK